MKIKLEIIKGSDGDAIKNCGIFNNTDEAYLKLRDEVVGVYIKEINYIRIIPKESNIEVLDFGSWKYFGRLTLEKE